MHLASPRCVFPHHRNPFSRLPLPSFVCKGDKLRPFVTRVEQISIPSQRPSISPKFTPEDLSFHKIWPFIANTLASNNSTSWGLPIFRTTYGNDDLWKLYLETLYRGSYRSLQRFGKESTLFPHFYCPVIEDPSLEGASKNAIRETFAKWVTDTSEERDGRGALKMRQKQAPPYIACLMANAYCLERFAEARDEEQRDEAPIIVYKGWHRPEWTDGEIHKEIDEYQDPEDIYVPDESELIFFEEIDGSRAPVLGWMFAEISAIPDLYNDLATNASYDAFYRAYARRPRVFADQEDDVWKVYGVKSIVFGPTHSGPAES
ncbi:hypothetical protein BO78DRAFT_415274 [Aspergillus sclerotiicarbonarius CBS 121057]|uniref:Uncharacterized protein n=1 Tax=Aspergillus sclerotiicarbonarius (strain CBS 121057 / IBT 28362) TaxID=1448318 RepID=A0A319EQ40_ASPSB|nr:hypothetical protein BO78DRAFT_415274 [Aspergillus sclerotiicarbonarius CBS 121057]